MGATNKQLQDKLNMANKTVAELMNEVETLKGELTDIDTLKELYANADMYAKDYAIENAALKAALKAEIERTNRHINLAENQLHREQQPLVVNHYHNCVINK